VEQGRPGRCWPGQGGSGTAGEAPARAEGRQGSGTAGEAPARWSGSGATEAVRGGSEVRCG
jgi:hypothetical protein